MGATERVKIFLEFKGISKYKFCQLLGFSNKFLDNSDNMGTDKACKILHHYPDINPEWLLTGIGNMIRSTVFNKENLILETLKTDKAAINQDIPLYDLQNTSEIIDLFSGSQNKTPIDYIKTPKLSKCDGALYVIGDSMYPMLKSGDIVIYKKVANHEHNILWGELYLIYINNDSNETFFTRYIKPSQRKEYVQLVAQNPQHDTIEFPVSSIKALALVTASIRINFLS